MRSASTSTPSKPTGRSSSRSSTRCSRILNSRVNAPFPYWRYLRLPKDRDLDRALVDIEAKVNEMIADVRRRMAADPSLYQAPSNFLEAIIAAKEAEGIEFSDADIFGNVCTLLLAGEDTTANTIAWAVNYFIEYPEHFARARAEVDAVLGEARSPQELNRPRPCHSSRPSTTRPCA
ncbi:MAG: cytochrome P450 [Proteobacteria bacterium]|nr:cytochrome P450 [Pseudomonadota bacterium]